MKFYSRPRRMPTVIIVSLIDILAILLIFVIVTTTFKSPQPEVVIKLPESATATSAANHDNPAVISISADGGLYMDAAKEPQTADEVKAAMEDLVKKTPDRPVAVKADKKAPFESVIKVMDILRETGVKNVPALTAPPNQ
ncbi:MAG: biopolymer transporter ExbD [Chthoniobacteraceae bacterium]